MKKSSKKLPQLDQLISVAGFVMALVALFFSWQANKLAKEANDIAKESNRIILSDMSPDVQILELSAVVSEDGCKTSSIFYVYSSADIYIIFSNMGGRSVSLIRIELPPTSLSVSVYDQNNQELTLPAEIPSGISKRWHFVAHGLIGHGDSEDSIQYNEKEKISGHVPVIWNFFFGDGKEINVMTTVYYASEKLNFDSDCSELGSWVK